MSMSTQTRGAAFSFGGRLAVRPVSYEPGDKLRFLIVEADAKPITITIAATPERFDRFLPQAEKVISTVMFAKD